MVQSLKKIDPAKLTNIKTNLVNKKTNVLNKKIDVVNIKTNVLNKKLVKVEEYTVVVFLSKTCPHCITYENNHDNLVSELNKNKNIKITIIKLFSNNDPDNMFNKYKVRSVPTAIVFKDLYSDKYSIVQGHNNSVNIIAATKLI